MHVNFGASSQLAVPLIIGIYMYHDYNLYMISNTFSFEFHSIYFTL